MKERIITGACLLAVALPIVYFGGILITGLLFLAAIGATWEMVNMRDKVQKVPNWVKAITFIGVLVMIFVPGFSQAIQFSVLAFSPLVIAGYVRTRKGESELSFYVLTIFYIGMSFRALLSIRNHSLALFIFLIVTVILTDSFAYFGGRLLGKKKLAPKISPNKTVEGAIFGWGVGTGFAVGFGIWQGLFNETWILIVLAVGLPIFGQIGDLIASALKRQHDIKDYGKLFPGHGGVMDRVDSQLLAAVLIYLMGWCCLGF